jgi:DNA-binding FadR family transcriptional regulator
MKGRDVAAERVAPDDEYLKVIAPSQARGSVPSVVRKAVQQLRDRILASEQNQFLGSEEELIEWLQVSRPTFRQVARLLEHEQLLRIKKGPGGGFFSQKPSLDAVVQLASVCLVSHRARLMHMAEAGSPLYIEAAKLAAQHPDAGQRARLQEFLTGSQDPAVAESGSAFVRLTEQFSELLLELSRNPVLSMFMHIVREFAAELHAGAGTTQEYRERYLQLVGALAQAIMAGDAEVAALMAARLNAETRRWIGER